MIMPLRTKAASLDGRSLSVTAATFVQKVHGPSNTTRPNFRSIRSSIFANELSSLLGAYIESNDEAHLKLALEMIKVADSDQDFSPVKTNKNIRKLTVPEELTASEALAALRELEVSHRVTC